MNLGLALGIAAALVFLDLLVAAILFLVKRAERRAYRHNLRALAVLAQSDAAAIREGLAGLPRERLFEALRIYADRCTPDPRVREAVTPLLLPQLRWLARDLRSPNRDRRILAAFRLRFFPGEEAAPLLAARLSEEASLGVRVRIVGSLVTLGAGDRLGAILDRLAREEEPERAATSYAASLLPLAPLVSMELSSRTSISRAEALLATKLGRLAPTEASDGLMLQLVRQADAEIAGRAAATIRKTRPESLADPAFLDHPLPEVRREAFRALGSLPDEESLERLLSTLRREEDAEFALAGLKSRARNRVDDLKTMLRSFYAEEDPRIRGLLADVLHDRIDFFLLGLRSPSRPAILALLSFLVDTGRVFSIAAFLRRNRDDRIENELCALLAERAAARPAIAADLAIALDERLRRKLGLSAPPPPPPKELPRARASDRIALVAAVALVVLTPFALPFLLGPGPAPGLRSILSFMARSYLSWFAWYALILNSISLGLLLLSVQEIRRQVLRKRSRSASRAFEERALPSVTVIVPAFREEKGIVESVRALLDQKYPSYEVVVVNDGSPDGTMAALQEAFRLERVEHRRRVEIGTATVLGVYRSAAQPRLLIIDKANGGKADALNAGIEVARGEYICGIDADSILEPDALYRAAVLALEEDGELLAAGGNILPANGCEVRAGDIARIGIPRAPLARFQTMEYLRAFLAGRLGWARLGTLLIISGAFGLFKRERVVEAGGYLTRRGPLKRDTVGEDMELVVRLVRRNRELRRSGRVRYAFDANCWTEVPEDARTLHRQRDRWQRGLLEILTYHRQLHFNPRYGRPGMIGTPYYLIFEVIGPFFELGGYLFLILGAILGIVPQGELVFTLTMAVLLGILVSLSSLAVAEYQVLYFSVRETMILLLYAFLENFGYRQWMSAVRVTAYFGYLRGKGAWGTMRRKGFSPAAR